MDPNWGILRRRDLLKTIALTGCGIAAAPMVNRGRFALRGASREYSARTVDLIAESVVVDALGLLTLDWDRLASWQADPQSLSADDVRLLRSSGTTVFHPAVELSGSQDPGAAARDCLSRWNAFLAARPDVFQRIDSVACAIGVKNSDRVGVLLGMQNSTHFSSPNDVARFYAVGQRVSQLTYNGNNALGGGCGERTDKGLTAFGAQIVTAMNRCGMAVDVSHASERTTLDAVAASAAPILVTHSNCKALVSHPRCKSDRVLRALAAQGGVIGLTGLRPFVAPPGGTIADLLDHFDHAVRVAGMEHVAIGTDSDPRGRRVTVPGCRRPLTIDVSGFDHPLRLFDLVEGMIARRYSNVAIRLILGGNVIRVFGEIENTRS